jgi:phytoene synthase
MSLLMSDEAECAALLRDGSKTFHAASRLLPARVGAAATALYAFCRVADDAVDAHGGAAAAVRDLQGRLARIYAGAPAPIAADRVFARAVALHRIPRELPAALLEGFAWDAAGKRYASLADVLDYAARVAGAVGAMMTVAMGVRSADVLSRACELGVAMQLTNIARDVGEDARAGRLYLPLDWLAEAGIDAQAWLAAPRMTPALRGVIRRLLDEADRLYAGASPGIAHLPRACRAGIYAARLLYAEIGQCAAATDFDCVAGRAVVPGRRKTVLLMRATALSLLPPAPADAPALPAVRYLVDAAAQTRRPEPRRLPLLRRAEERVVWVMELFASLDARRSAG